MFKVRVLQVTHCFCNVRFGFEAKIQKKVTFSVNLICKYSELAAFSGQISYFSVNAFQNQAVSENKCLFAFVKMIKWKKSAIISK